MKFVVDDKVFEKVPDMYIGVVAAKGIDNAGDYPEIGALLDSAIAAAQAIDDKQDLQDINYRKLRETLLTYKQILTLPAE